MKKKTLILILFILGNSNLAWSQVKDTIDIYPNVGHDFVETNNQLIDLYIQLGVFCVTGVGANFSYFLPNKFYTSIDLGFGFAEGWDYEPEFEPNIGLMLNLDINAGYILFSDIKRSESRWVVKEERRGSKVKVEYFKIAAPRHRYLIAELGYSMNPTSWYTFSNGGGSEAGYNFYAPALNLGLRWKTIRNVFVEVIDKETKEKYSGRHRAFGEIYAGFVVPLKKQIDSPDISYDPIEKTKSIGFSIFGKIAPYDNWSMYLGYKTIGYGDASHFVIGASFYIGSARR